MTTADEFLQKQLELRSNQVRFERFKPDQYIDVIRFQYQALGSVFSSPYVLEFYLNRKLYIRIPSLTLEESERFIKLDHNQLNFLGSSFFKMYDFLSEYNTLAAKYKKYSDDYLPD
jgi:hypothetical protein